MFTVALKNISNFNDVTDYLPILNGIIITDIIVIFLLLRRIIKSSVLEIWYREFSSGAVIADVLIIFIGIIIARFIYPIIFVKYSLLKFIGLVVVIQVAHDILFFLFVSSVPRGMSRILDVFKDYGKENGVKAIISDSAMMASSVVIASYLKGLSLNANIIVLIVSVYLVPYFIYSIY